MYNFETIKATIYSNQSKKMKETINKVQEEIRDLTIDELGTLSILIELEKEIKKNKKEEKIIKLPTVI